MPGNGSFVYPPCRKSAKARAHAAVGPSCPHCGAPMAAMGTKFKAPPSADDRAWRVITDLTAAGLFYFGERDPRDVERRLRNLRMRGILNARLPAVLVPGPGFRKALRRDARTDVW